MAQPKTPEELYDLIERSGLVDIVGPVAAGELRRARDADTLEEATEIIASLLGEDTVQQYLDTDINAPPLAPFQGPAVNTQSGRPTGPLPGADIGGVSYAYGSQAGNQAAYAAFVTEQLRERGIEPTPNQLAAIAQGLTTVEGALSTPEETLEEIIARGPGTPPPQRPPLLGGVGEEEPSPLVTLLNPLSSAPTQAAVPGSQVPGGGFINPDGSTTYDARYRDGDQWRDFVNKSTETIALYQQRLVSAGLISESQFSEGTWGQAEENAMAYLMGLANQNGKVWSHILSQFEANPITQPGRVFPGLVYREPDYATLAQAAKQTVNQKLGRDAQDWEVELLADELKGASRAAFDKDLVAARKEFYGSGGNLGTVERINPMDRFNEEFEKLYAPEIDRKDRVEQTQQNFVSLINSFGAAQREVEDR